VTHHVADDTGNGKTALLDQPGFFPGEDFRVQIDLGRRVILRIVGLLDTSKKLMQFERHRKLKP